MWYYAADPGDYVKQHALQRETDAEIVNHDAGKYSKKGSQGAACALRTA